MREVGEVRAAIGQFEALPFANVTFDVTLIMNALEYADARAAIREISRVTRPGGVVILTMLNPLSLYRLTEWFIYWPLVRIAGAIEKSVGVSPERRHGARMTGMRTFSARRLKRLMKAADLEPVDLIYYDVTPLLPPLDRLPAVARRAARIPHERTIDRGWRRCMGTAYLIVARPR